MGDATAPIAPHLRQLLADCRRLMTDEPGDHPTLHGAWLDLTYEMRIGATDRQWLAESDWVTKQAQRYRGRILHAGPSDRGRGRRHGFISPAARRRIREECPWCVYCGGPASALDHIWPWSRGGSNHRTNLAPSCARCNRAKLDLTVDEWRADRVARGLPWPLEPYWSEEARLRVRRVTGSDVLPRGPVSV